MAALSASRLVCTVTSLISETMLPICPMRLSSDCTLPAERSTTSRIAWVLSRALPITASIARCISSAVSEACWISPSCASTMRSISPIAPVIASEVAQASALRPSICSLVCPTAWEAPITSPTVLSRLSMKLLIQRAMSPVSSLLIRLPSRRWLRLPPPSAMPRITPVISSRRRARRRGPKVTNSRLDSASRPTSSSSRVPSGRPL